MPGPSAAEVAAGVHFSLRLVCRSEADDVHKDRKLGAVVSCSYTVHFTLSGSVIGHTCRILTRRVDEDAEEEGAHDERGPVEVVDAVDDPVDGVVERLGGVNLVPEEVLQLWNT